ncbi:recQ-mediated genome instability protein 1 [Betta splendens]|uniref:RecQ-mediated genome instability protein 1 n=1 Tax=Betta splendens TaxID=158456 RepID=A0A6P7NK19_BETSP|nr:recQ-mediated genome instability protein 1 [Betta splendens]
MGPEIRTVVRSTQTWLQSTWHIHVPFAWLEACVDWLQEEAGGAGHLSQQQINQQALDQWLLTDLRDLDYPVLPEGLDQAQKTELSGIFCVQVDSLMDISQPAYGQLQKWKGTDCTNDEVSAVTQTTQRSWEARPTRMLLLQVTDGVQNLKAMEYRPIPVLNTALRPGVKIQLQGQMVCRLGVLLLGPCNIKILGGEVEDLIDRNHQGRVLCRTLGLPEEEQQQHEEERSLPALQQGNQDVEVLELEDAELLASLEAQDVVERVQAPPVQDSGYRTLSINSLTRSMSVRSVVSATSSRGESSLRSNTSGFTQSGRDGSVKSHYRGNEQDQTQQEIQVQNMADQDFPDEDFDDLPLDELDSVIYQESTNVIPQSGTSHRNTPENTTRIMETPGNLDRVAKSEQHTSKGFGSCSKSTPTIRDRDYKGSTRGSTVQSAASTPFPPAASKPSHESEFVTNNEGDVMDEDMDFCTEELDMFALQSTKTDNERSQSAVQGQSFSPTAREADSTVPAVTLTSPPFTYLCLLEDLMSKPHPHTTEIHVKAFIVTLLGKLSSNNGVWRVCATISDGTGYLDVELSDKVLTSLLGFSVAEKGLMKRDPARRGELEAGMRRCQEQLVDMCCVMTIVVEPVGKKAVVTKAEPINEKVLQELEQRVKDSRK